MRAHLALFLGFTALSAGLALAGPGHDHGDGGHGEQQTSAADVPRLESYGTDLELVVTAKGHDLTIYLDRIATNEPVDGASIEISGAGIPAGSAKPKGDGVYKIDADWADVPGSKALTFVVTANGKTDLLNGVLLIPAPAKSAGAASLGIADLFKQSAVWTIAALAALFGFALAFAFRPMRFPSDTDREAATPSSRSDDDAKISSFKVAAEMIVIAMLSSAALTTDVRAGPGHDHGDHGAPAATAGGETPRKLPEGDVFLPKPSQRLLHVRTAIASPSSAQSAVELIGTVMADPATEGRVQAPMDGQIELSQAGVSFVGRTVKAGDVLALLSPSIPVFDRGSLQQATAEVEGKIKIAEQKLSRLTRISEYVARREIDDTKAELDALREQKRVLAPKNAEKLQLKAPVSGIISVAQVRAGQVVSARDTLFEIVDPKSLWIEAIGPSGHDLDDVAAAHAIDAEGHKISLKFVGQAPSLRQQAKTLQFKVMEQHDALSIGTALKVAVQKGKPVEGMILPEQAVVRGINGLPQIWTKVSAERFKAVAIKPEPLDGAQVLIVKGLDPGARVVVDGAEFINQVR